MDTPKCFLDKERECGGDCMAFVHTSMGERLIQCGILMNLNALSEVRDIVKGKPEMNDPRSPHHRRELRPGDRCGNQIKEKA